MKKSVLRTHQTPKRTAVLRCNRHVVARMDALAEALSFPTREDLLEAVLQLVDTYSRYAGEGYRLALEKDGQSLPLTVSPLASSLSATAQDRARSSGPLSSERHSSDTEVERREQLRRALHAGSVSVPVRIVEGFGKIVLETRSRPWRRSGRRNDPGPLKRQIISFLSHHTQPSARLIDVARALVVYPPTASEAVRRLARDGFVTVQPHRTDHRAVSIALTGKGRRAAQETRLWDSRLAKAARTLTDGEQQALAQHLETLLAAIDRQNQLT